MSCIPISNLFDRITVGVDELSFQILKIDEKVDADLINQHIRSSYDIWSKANIEVGSPVRETIEKTASYVYKDGYMVVDKHNNLVGIYNLDLNTTLTQRSGNYELNRNGRIENFESHGLIRAFEPNQRVAYFYRFAVRQDQQGNGIGTQILTNLFDVLREKGISHLVLDTQVEAKWLYDWYLRLGFKDIGLSPVDQYGLRTHLLIKDLKGE